MKPAHRDKLWANSTSGWDEWRLPLRVSMTADTQTSLCVEEERQVQARYQDGSLGPRVQGQAIRWFQPHCRLELFPQPKQVLR